MMKQCDECKGKINHYAACGKCNGRGQIATLATHFWKGDETSIKAENNRYTVHHKGETFGPYDDFEAADKKAHSLLKGYPD